MVIGTSFAFGGIIYATVTVRKTLNAEMQRQKEAELAELSNIKQSSDDTDAENGTPKLSSDDGSIDEGERNYNMSNGCVTSVKVREGTRQVPNKT